MILLPHGHPRTVPLSGSSKLTRPSCSNLRASAPMNAFVMLAIANVVRAVTRLPLRRSATPELPDHMPTPGITLMAAAAPGSSWNSRCWIEHALNPDRQLRRHRPVL